MADQQGGDAAEQGQGTEEVHRLVKQRQEKLEKIREAGLNPYANDFRPELSCAEFYGLYDDETAEALEGINKIHTVAGRVMGVRTMGKVTFVKIRDRTRDLQVFVQKNRVGDATYKHLKMIDLGDIIGVAGAPMRTKTGELSIAAEGFRVLTKAVRPLPDKFHGLQDVEQRYRQRYVDLVMNTEVREVFKTRTRIIRGIQKFLDTRDFIEVETPILGDVAGGAAARPFTTHHNALDMPLQMRIATELHLKRLVVGGLERVYEIGRLFRNEGVDTTHNPEFTTIEFYMAYATYTDLMDLTEELISSLVDEVHGSEVIKFGDRQIDFTTPWRRVPIAKLVQEHLGLDEDLTRIDSVHKALEICKGHTVTDEEPLWLCLKELSDEEAAELIPGLKAGSEPIAERARAALKAGGDDFYAKLGEAIDSAFRAEVDAENNDFLDADTGDEVTAPNADDATPAEGTPRLPKLMRIDGPYARRRRLALHLLYAVFDHEVEDTITNPTFITDFSVSASPLARRRDSDPAVVDRFELIVAGMEMANAFSELNDPADQKQRFLDQLRDRERGDGEAPEMDEDYIRALEYGMPPTAGEGIGIDRLVMLLTDNPSIREVILFPLLRRLD
jgi:lysyl-tRNA synthetase class 2